MELGFIKTLQQEWPTLSAAPWSVAIVAIICLSVGFGIARLYYGGTLLTLRERLQLYQDRLQGASPDEAKAKIDALQRTIDLTIGTRWEPLTNNEIISLSAKVSALEKRRLRVMYGNQLGKELAECIFDAFFKAGWPVDFTEGGGLGVGISTGRGNGMANTLKQVIEATTKLKVGLVGADEPDNPDFVFVGVGINSN